MPGSLKHDTVKAASWRMAELLCQRAGSLIVSIVLARLLMPEEFGTVALLSIFVQLSNVIVNAGFGPALIQRQQTTHLEESSVFYCNIAMAILLYAVLYFLAPIVPVFYDKPELAELCPLLRVLALTLIIGSVGQVQTTLLAKNLDYKPLFIASIITLIAQALSGITLAYYGFGVWALVLSQLVSGTVRVVLICRLSQWRAAWRFSFSALLPLFAFGWKLLVSGLLDSFFMQVYGLMIGRFYAPSDLAFFNRGREWPSTIAVSLSGTVASVLFPALSKIQDDAERMKRAVQKSLQLVAFLLWPCLVGLALTAETVVELLLTEKWLPSVPYMRLLCIVMCLYPLHAINLQVLVAKGYSGLFLRLEIIKKSLYVIMLIITLPYGIMAMVYGQLFSSAICLYINTHYTSRLIGYPLHEQLRAVVPTLTGTLVMSVAVYYSAFITGDLLLRLVVQILVGGVLYLALSCLMKNPACGELIVLVQERMRGIPFRRVWRNDR